MEKKWKYKLKEGAAEEVIRGKIEHSEDSKSLNDAEFFDDEDDLPSLDSSETDEEAEEGLGDGNIGRPVRNPEE
jgi:hypothetical protein